MQDKITFGVIGLLVGIVATWAFANLAVNNYNPRMMGFMGMGSTAQMMDNIDQHFIEQMIPHHDDAITMANIALQKAEHQEIKDLANNIIKSQSQEIIQMKQWEKDWFGSSTSLIPKALAHGHGDEGTHMGMMGGDTDLEKLKNAQPFDKAFIEDMIPHHQMAVMMAQMLEQSTTRPEMKKLAQNIISAQNKEIEQMRNWYSQWYK